MTFQGRELPHPWVALTSRRLVAGVYRQSLWDRIASTFAVGWASAWRAEACEAVLNVGYADIGAVSAYPVGNRPGEPPELTRIATEQGMLDIKLDIYWLPALDLNGVTLGRHVQWRIQAAKGG